MRPVTPSPAHATDRLAELVCSNSLGSDLPDRAAGLLKTELRRLGSLILACADAARVPAGGALAVDRDEFARRVTERVSAHPRVRLVRAEARALPGGPGVIASGPLTSPALSAALAELTGEHYLYFYDALAPIVTADSIDLSIAFRASRYDQGGGEGGDGDGGDYINCPLDEDEYNRFVEALASAETIQLREFERATITEQGVPDARPYFEGCLPVEVLARRGRDTLAFGPLRPVGLREPRTGHRPHAVVQLRRDNRAGTLYNLVGFQTNLTWPEQRRVLRTIPGLAQASFARYGQMHRNTFINSPLLLEPSLRFRRDRRDLFCAGQITGVEGYVGNAGTGLLAGLNAARLVQGLEPLELPRTTMLGALCWYVTHAEPEHFQPMKAAYGLLPELPIRSKQQRNRAYVARARADLEAFIAAEPGALPVPAGGAGRGG
jgi:methylenetetrahydrofolate--tRNA-(uracil-5-)-methyltransferase